MIELHNLPKEKGKKKARRVGRGSSHRGGYSGRGSKGQKARSGVSGLRQRSIRDWLLKVPKARGFKSLRSDKEIVKLGVLDKYFADGDKVDAKILYKKGLISDLRAGVKILGGGRLSKKLNLKVAAVSQTAKQAVESAGGKIELVGKSSLAETDKSNQPK